MESSRSSLLSTMLMTLPLIVVPAIALLRSPDSATGVSTRSLGAASSRTADSDVFEESYSEDSDDSFSDVGFEDDFDSMFTETTESSASVSSGKTKAVSGSQKSTSDTEKKSRSQQDAPDAALRNPFEDSLDGTEAVGREVSSGTAFEEFSESDGGSDVRRTSDTLTNSEKIVEQLNAMGAIRTLWFEAGSRSPVGLAVFFRGPTELTRIRFEAVGESRDFCARNVLDQVTRWQAERNEQNTGAADARDSF